LYSLRIFQKTPRVSAVVGNARVRRWRGERRREQIRRPQCHSCCRFFGHEDLQLRARLSRRRCIGVPRAQGPDLSRPIVLNDESTKSQDNSKYWPAVCSCFGGCRSRGRFSAQLSHMAQSVLVGVLPHLFRPRICI
jgi:hypothetical protein